MKLASILPLSMFQHTYDGPYAMLLTHLKDYYPTCSNRNCYRILDNSLIELGNAVTMDAIYEAACQLNVDEIILPDVYQHGERTIESVKQAILWLKRHHALYRFKLMAVCQGEDLADFEKCFFALNRMPEINCIGIPKVATTLIEYGRPRLEYLWSYGKTCKQIHLLGCWTSLDEYLHYKNPQLIRSMDTCIPSLLAREGITDIWHVRPEKTIDFVHDKVDTYCYHTLLAKLANEGLL